MASLARSPHERELGAIRVADSWESLAEYASTCSEISGAGSRIETGIVEITLITARTLIGFLSGNHYGVFRADDIKANDFLDSPWYLDQADDRELRGWLPVINKNLAHLSWEALDDIVSVPATFLAHLTSWHMAAFAAEAERQTSEQSAAFRAALTRVNAVMPPRQRWRSTVVPLAPARR